MRQDSHGLQIHKIFWDIICANIKFTIFSYPLYQDYQQKIVLQLYLMLPQASPIAESTCRCDLWWTPWISAALWRQSPPPPVTPPSRRFVWPGGAGLSGSFSRETSCLNHWPTSQKNPLVGWVRNMTHTQDSHSQSPQNSFFCSLVRIYVLAHDVDHMTWRERNRHNQWLRTSSWRMWWQLGQGSSHPPQK